MTKVVLCGSRHTFATFSEDELHFFVAGGRRCTLETSILAGAALTTCRVACFLRITLPGLREVVTMCKFRGRRGVL